MSLIINPDFSNFAYRNLKDSEGSLKTKTLIKISTYGLNVNFENRDNQINIIIDYYNWEVVRVVVKQYSTKSTYVVKTRNL
jgi:hypothetical protein